MFFPLYDNVTQRLCWKSVSIYSHFPQQVSAVIVQTENTGVMSLLEVWMSRTLYGRVFIIYIFCIKDLRETDPLAEIEYFNVRFSRVCNHLNSTNCCFLYPGMGPFIFKYFFLSTEAPMFFKVASTGQVIKYIYPPTLLGQCFQCGAGGRTKWKQFTETKV